LGMEENIHFMGPSSDIPGALARAKAFLMSSDFEGMPNGMLEAMAVGLPCIVTECPCGGPKAVIESGKDGILVPVSDEDAFYQALCRLEENPDFRKSVAEQAKEKAEMFSPGKIFAKWEEYIMKVAKM